ncbi:MAG: Stk1 family PASTA domain-containing Ser/Thr kinase [Bacillota bacterium]
MIDKIINERYKIIKELGKGGMAIVFEAKDLLLDRKVAIKMLRSEYNSNKEFIKKFRQEARAVARISHPNVVSIYDIGEDEDCHYLVMEKVEGENLKDIINNRKKLSIVESLDIANQICSALIVAHENNIIHCDIKPHNILINSDKKVKVTDFGIARAVSNSTLTMTDTIMGSAHYFSPEQARGGKIKAHSDLYSVGIVLYEMLTGQVPFTGNSPVSVALKHIQEKIKEPKDVNPEIPSKVNNLIMKAVNKEPEKRFNSAKKMKKEITKILKELTEIKEKKSSKIIEESDSGDTKIIKKSDIFNNKRDSKKITKAKTDGNKKESNHSKKKSILLSGWSRRLMWMGLILGIIILGSIGVGYFFKIYTDVPIVEVPDFTGEEIDDARSIASENGLNVEVENNTFSSEYEQDQVISQNPDPGERIRQTRPIMVIVSKGPSMVEMPDLIDKTYREARVILENEDLTIDEEEFVYDDEVPADQVIEQEPEPETDVNNDDNISLVISEGPEPNMIKVPEVVGLEQDEAEERLKDNYLRTGEISEEESSRYPEGEVVDQEYEAGEEIAENTEVDLTISSGLKGADENEVHTRTVNFEVYGFDSQEVRIIVEDENGEEEVYNEMHEPGDQVSTTINSVGPTNYKIYIDDELIHEQNFE